jgi:hypothetical protein
MTRKRLAAFVTSVALALSVPAGAFAVGGPNEAGNSGHFHPKKNPCVANPDHPHCPGPH